MLARALHDASQGRYASAARSLGAIDRSRLWYQLSWPPHPKPSLLLGAEARPAFEQFLVDFTRAYGQADMKALGDSVDALAVAFEALAPKRQD